MTQRSTRSATHGAEALLEPGFFDELRLSWRLLRDERVALPLKMGVPAVAALYLISPIDALPDFLPLLGQMDDFGMLVVALLVMVRLIPRFAPAAVVDEHRRDLGTSRARSSTGQPDFASQQVVDARFRVSK